MCSYLSPQFMKWSFNFSTRKMEVANNWSELSFSFGFFFSRPSDETRILAFEFRNAYRLGRVFKLFLDLFTLR